MERPSEVGPPTLEEEGGRQKMRVSNTELMCTSCRGGLVEMSEKY